MTVGELIKELARYDFNAVVEIRLVNLSTGDTFWSYYTHRSSEVNIEVKQEHTRTVVVQGQY